MSRIEQLVHDLAVEGKCTVLEALVILEAFNNAFFDEEEVGKSIIRKYVEMKNDVS